MIEKYRNIYTTFALAPQKINRNTLTIKKPEHNLRSIILDLVDPQLYNFKGDQRRLLVSLLSKANFGCATLEYNGFQKRYVGFSNLDTFEDWSIILPSATEVLSGWSIAEKVDSPKFKTEIIDENGDKGTLNAFDRNVCTESKIIEAVAFDLANNGYNNKISGIIDLYTDRRPCRSCVFVMARFNLSYPSIKIRTFHK